ncbi:MAG: U32 family peptidase [Nanobdellota archaeon]
MHNRSIKIFSVPCTYEDKDIPFLVKSGVKEVYGSFGNKFLPSARPSSHLKCPKISLLKKYIEKLHRHKIQFSYIMNAPVKPDTIKLKRTIKTLQELKIDTIVITNQDVIKKVKKIWPDVNIKASAVARINTISKAEKLRKNGVREIILDPSLNYNKSIIRKFIKKGCTPTLIVNECCINGCPYRDEHYKAMTKNKTDIFLVRCNAYKLLHTEEYNKATWIPPEKIEEYKQLGVENFKIAGRDFSSEWIRDAIRAYSTGKYNNIYEILTGGKINPKKLSKTANLVPKPIAYISVKLLSTVISQPQIKILSLLNYKEFDSLINYIYNSKKKKNLKPALQKVLKSSEKELSR